MQQRRAETRKGILWHLNVNRLDKVNWESLSDDAVCVSRPSISMFVVAARNPDSTPSAIDGDWLFLKL